MSNFIKNTEKIASIAALTEICNEIDNKSYDKLSQKERDYISQTIAKISKKEANIFLCHYLTDSLQNSYQFGYIKPFDNNRVLKEICAYHNINYLDKALKEGGDTYCKIYEYIGAKILTYHFDPKDCKFGFDMCSAIFDNPPALDFSRTMVELVFQEEDKIERLLSLIHSEYNEFNSKNRRGHTTKNKTQNLDYLPLYTQNLLASLDTKHCEKLHNILLTQSENYFDELQELFQHPLSQTYRLRLDCSQEEMRAKQLSLLLDTSFIDQISLAFSWSSTGFRQRLETINDIFLKHYPLMLQENQDCVQEYLYILGHNLLRTEAQPELKKICLDALENLFMGFTAQDKNFSADMRDYILSILDTEATDLHEEDLTYVEKLKITLFLDPKAHNNTKTLKI